MSVKVDNQLMDEIVDRIVKTIHPKKIILFGSRARGESRPDSDLDILGIADSEEPRYKRSCDLYLALSDILMPMDIVVYTPEEVDKWKDASQAFITTAVREGKLVYVGSD